MLALAPSLGAAAGRAQQIGAVAGGVAGNSKGSKQPQ